MLRIPAEPSGTFAEIGVGGATESFIRKDRGGGGTEGVGPRGAGSGPETRRGNWSRLALKAQWRICDILGSLISSKITNVSQIVYNLLGEGWLQ